MPARLSSRRSSQQPSQRARPVRRNLPSSDEDDDDAPSQTQNQTQNGHTDGDEDEDGMDVDDEPNTDLKHKANKLARLAIFTEHRRVTLKRDEITKKVLGSQTRQFNQVLDAANRIIRRTFAMELVELRTVREMGEDAGGPQANGATEDLEEARRGMGKKKKSIASGSKQYIVRSTLSPLIIELAAQTDEHILEEEAMDAMDEEDEEGNSTGGNGMEMYGSLVSWSTADSLGALGLTYVILALILVNGKVLGDMDLKLYLRQLKFPLSSSVSLPSTSAVRSLSIDKFLDGMIKGGYVIRESTDAAAKGGAKKGGASAGQKRGRKSLAAAALDDDGSAYAFEWKWGPRAEAEIGEEQIAKWVAEFMIADSAGPQGADGAGRPNMTERQKKELQAKVDKMYTGVEKAAGGKLRSSDI